MKHQPGTSHTSQAGFPLCAALVLAFSAIGCQSIDRTHQVLVSAAEQRMVLLEKGQLIKEYPVSTSKYGLGDKRNSYQTPTGKMIIASKIGDNAPSGAVFKSRRWTGEVLPPDAPGRDPVLTRILWLKGRELETRNAYSRLIYIHGTPEERNIGRPVSFGCIRMKSSDVIDLYNRVGVGTPVTVLPGRMPMAVRTASFRKAIASGQMLAWNKPKHAPPAAPTPAQAVPSGDKADQKVDAKGPAVPADPEVKTVTAHAAPAAAS
jgi:hypothetical protein